MIFRKRYSVQLPGRTLELGERTLVMGIINVTPDSFADGGLRFDPQRAIADGLQMIEDGADILDIGGESTRPGADAVPAAEELRRVLPVVSGLSARSRVPISIDTYKATVARDAVAAGATIINDISGFQYDAALGSVAAETGAGVVLMHTRGRSRSMYELAEYRDVLAEVRRELEAAIERATAAGVKRDAIIIDPGLGFAKKASHSFEIMANLNNLRALDRPIAIGPSRKSFLTAALGDRTADDRDWGTAGAVAASILLGAHMVRVHAVREMKDVVRIADRVLETLRSRAASQTAPL